MGSNYFGSFLSLLLISEWLNLVHVFRQEQMMYFLFFCKDCRFNACHYTGICDSFLNEVTVCLLGNKMVVNILDRLKVSGMKNYVPELVEYWTILFETFDKELKINSFPITNHIIDAYLYQRGRWRSFCVWKQQTNIQNKFS